MKLALLFAHARMIALVLLRSPGFIVPSIVFPAMFFALFALPYATTAAIADVETLSFMIFAISGVCLYQFGVGVAAERGRPWERYLRTLPVPPGTRLAARIACAAPLGIAAAAVVAIVARLFAPVDLSAAQWLLAFGLAFGGAVPFVLIGITIGYWASARAAVPIATAFNLLLAYAGALWMPPEMLPHLVQAISPYLPTRAFGDLLWSIVGSGNAARGLAVLAVYAILFALLASVGYRRDERKRYA